MPFLVPCTRASDPPPFLNLQSVEEQFKSGRLYARISSRPGQSGRCDGCVRLAPHREIRVSLTARCRYILEGRELEFYVKKMQKKKGKQ